MIDVHRFEAWHVDAMGEIISEFENIEAHKSFVKAYDTDGDSKYALTLAVGEKPIAVIGGTFIYPEVMSVFSLLSEDIKRYPIGVTREVKRIIDLFFKECGLNRMQMEVKSNHDEAFDWALVLGFKVEGVMHHYGLENQDYYLFARYQ